MKKANKIKQKFDIFMIVVYVVVIIYVLSMIYMLYSGLINTFKGFGDYFDNYLSWPKKNPNPLKEYKGFTLENYLTVFRSFFMYITPSGAPKRKVYLAELYYNTALYAFFMSAFSIITQVITAYAVSKYKFRFGSVLYAVGIIVMLVPIVGSLPSQIYFAYDVFRFKNSLIGICIMNCKYPGIYFLVFYAAFKSVPWTYAEAAQIDGAGHLRIFWEIMLPMVSSTIFAVFVLFFIQYWNDYLTPMIFLPDMPTVSYALYDLSTSVEPEVDGLVVLTAAFVSCIPVIVLFAAFKNIIMGNVAVGGIKG